MLLNQAHLGPRWRVLEGSRAYLVVVVEQAQRGGTVFIPVDAHHGFGGRRERVFQERLPGFILASVGAPLWIQCFILKNQHRPFALEEFFLKRKNTPVALTHIFFLPQAAIGYFFKKSEPPIP